MAGPLIAVTGPRRGALGPRSLVSLVLRWYGARVVQLRPGDRFTSSAFNGVVVTGGHDVDPVLYAAEPEVEPRNDPERDRLETAVIREALGLGLPLLGICRGAQLLNVCCGGSLFQELRSRRQHTSNRWTVLPLKTLNIEPGSLLAKTMGASATARINSLHNQAIDRLGDGLVVSAQDLDGIVQAIEAPDREFVLGVQWHPEFLILMLRQRRLFGALVAAARKTSLKGQA